jgi:hypothetical protein
MNTKSGYVSPNLTFFGLKMATKIPLCKRWRYQCGCWFIGMKCCKVYCMQVKFFVGLYHLFKHFVSLWVFHCALLDLPLYPLVSFTNSYLLIVRATLDEGPRSRDQWIQAILLVESCKLVPRPLDKGPRPKIGKLRVNLHGTCFGGKINWFWPKNSGKRRAPDLENQESS